MKKRLFFLILCIYIALFISNNIYADIDHDLENEPIQEGFQNKTYITLLGILDLKGEIEYTGGDIPVNWESKRGFSIGLEIIGAIGEKFGLGIGAVYQFPRAIEEFPNEKFNFIPIYGISKFYLPIDSITTFGMFHLGYNFLRGNEYFTDYNDYKVEKKGGIYWGIGGGVIFSPGIQVGFLYSTNRGKKVPDNSDYNEIKMVYTKVSLLIGINF